MREFKFRAWERIVKVMINGLPRICVSGIGGNKHGYKILSKIDNYYDRLILMQYTELKDCNGIKIFEGDILEFTVFDHNGHDTQCKGNVKFEHGRFEIWNALDSEYYGTDEAFELFWVFAQDEEIKITGNIHENPELLRKE